MNRDSKYLWHPLTQHKVAGESLEISKTEGVHLYDAAGNSYIDAISSWYTAIYGHRNPKVLQALKESMDSIDQVVFTGFTHKPAMDLGEKLIDIAPGNLSKLFFSDNGSTTVDIALKMCLQYWYNKGIKKTGIIAFDNAFHGDTFGAMAVSDLDVYNGPFRDHLLRVDRIPVPNSSNFDTLKNKFQELLKDAMCFIYEPLVQGAAGMHMYNAEQLDELIQMAQNAGVLCVADEVMTGFGKTGSNFASDQLESSPDIMCLSKALTCGMLPMGLTLATEEVFKAFYDQELIKGFFHGHTYSANPLACAAAVAGIDLLLSPSIQNRIEQIASSHADFIEEIHGHPLVHNPRCLGVILAFEFDVLMDRYGSKRNELYQFFMDRGVYLRPLGNTIYIVPPYIVSNEELNIIYDAIRSLLNR